ncbi:flagellar protein FlgN [Ruminococcaceae bacterium OttesenSCG-928-L11]|nr:flagellar protein FlgN [Ruminococcaceae bacterium OttesenSCG-928-L11]
MKQIIDKFYSYLNDLADSYQKLSVLLNEKIQAVHTDDLPRLDEIIAEEQVYQMIARGFDQNAKTYRDRLGLEGETLKAIIEELPEEHRPRFREVHARLSMHLNESARLNDSCQKMLEVKLHTVNRKLEEAGRPPVAPTNTAKPKPGIFNKTV